VAGSAVFLTLQLLYGTVWLLQPIKHYKSL
jgi:hypothetical protein